jgi:hypothetical protein
MMHLGGVITLLLLHPLPVSMTVHLGALCPVGFLSP